MTRRRIPFYFLALILSLSMGVLSFLPNLEPAEAVPLPELKDDTKWEPLQNPEPSAQGNVSYSKLCAVTEPGYNNARTKKEDSDLWFERDMDICTLASGGAQIRPVRDLEAEAQGYYTYEANFNMIGAITDWQYTSDPSFHVFWGKAWELDSVAFQPLSAFEGWGTASQPINGITQYFDLNVCRQHRWGYCQPENITWDWIDPNEPKQEKDTERFRMPILHLPSNSGTWQSFLMEKDGWEWDKTKWWKPELHYLNHFQTPSFSNINNAQALADSIGGDWSIEYDTADKKGNKKAKILFRIKRKDGQPVTEKPFVGAVYKSWDKNDRWQMAQFLSSDPNTQEYYQPLRVEEKLQKNNYATGKKIPSHDLNIHFQGDGTAYWKNSAPGRNSDTCQVEDYYLKQYRYKAFDEPDSYNPFSILGLRDPDTGQVSNFVTKVDPYDHENIWWETSYRGFKVVLRGDKFKDGNGVNNWRLEWIPDANTPTEPEITNISINMPTNEYRIASGQTNAAHPIIMVTQENRSPMPADTKLVVEITKPDRTKTEVVAKTDRAGKLVALDGTPLATDTSQIGNYQINVTKQRKTVNGKDVDTPLSCVTINRTYDHYEVYDSDRFVEVQKVDGNNVGLLGSRFIIYSDLNGQPDKTKSTTLWPPNGKLGSSWTTRAPLKIGQKYWLVETTAPLGHELAMPIQFTVESDRIVLGKPNDDSFTAIVTGNTATPITAATGVFPSGAQVKNSHVIKVRDVQAGKMPATGGRGLVGYSLAGVLVIALGCAMNRKYLA